MSPLDIPNTDVVAEVNYADVPPGQLVTYQLDHEWSGFAPEAALVSIHDARYFDQPPTLAREGFLLARIDSAVTNFADPKQIDQLWRPAVHELVKRETRADGVISWAFGARFSERDRLAKRTPVSNPARRVHSDFGPSDFVGVISHPTAVEELDKLSGGRKLKRWLCINVWQQISPAPADMPLALCDATSVAFEDIVEARGLFSVDGVEGGVNLCLARRNPAHRWCYFSDMQSGDALLFSGLDPQQRDNMHVVFHTAFDNPLRAADGVPRSSIEIRTMALFFD